MTSQLPIVTYNQLANGITHIAQRSYDGGLESRAAFGSTTRVEVLAEISNALHHLELARHADDVMIAVPDQVTSLLQTFLAKQALESGLVEEVESGGLEAKFDNYDILGWMGSFFHWWKGIRPHSILPGTLTPGTIPNVFRLAVLADWGTGLYGAPVCAESIKQDARGFKLMFHLGDVYYAGDEDEIRDRLLRAWPTLNNVTSRYLNGNHEMYSGGHAYFTKALPQVGQSASYFAIQNDFWNLVALDTAYLDHDLTPDQMEWIHRIFENTSGRKTVLFTHHQPFSLFDQQGPKLITKLAPFLTEKKIFAWYWGHEHRCVLYDRHPSFDFFGRCVGHGGFPYFRDNFGTAPRNPLWRPVTGKNLVPAAKLLDGRNPFIKGHEDQYGPHGYLTLEFDDQHLREVIHSAEGEILYDHAFV